MIFPYPYGIVHAETGDAKFPGEAFGLVVGGSVGPEVVVGK